MANIVINSTANAAMSDYPLALQATGGDPGIQVTAPDLRQFIDVVALEGVCGMGDFRVTQRAAGANLTVDFAAGRAIVKGDSVTRQGKFVADSTGTVNTVTNLTVPGAGTRTHHAILRILDKQAAGASYGYSLEILEDTGTGKPALPASAISLAEIAIPAGSGSITNAMITDTRPYALTHGVLDAQTLLASAASVVFDGIPPLIKSLRISWNGRCTGAGGQFALGLRINGDTVTNYGSQWSTQSGAAGTTVTVGAAAQNYARVGLIPGNTTTLFAGGIIEIPKWNTRETVQRVNIFGRSSFWETAASNAMETAATGWVGTTQPTSITLLPLAGSFVAGSQFTLEVCA